MSSIDVIGSVKPYCKLHHNNLILFDGENFKFSELTQMCKNELGGACDGMAHHTVAKLDERFLLPTALLKTRFIGD